MNKAFCLLALTAVAAAAPAQAFDATCELYVKAAEKTAEQPARQSISESDGIRLEAIIVDGVMYSRDSPKARWRKAHSGFGAIERSMVADIRNGTSKIDNCKKLGSETVEGVATTVVEYRLTIPGSEPGTSKAYIGKDGLIYAQAAGKVRIVNRYSGVTVPKL